MFSSLGSRLEARLGRCHSGGLSYSPRSSHHLPRSLLLWVAVGPQTMGKIGKWREVQYWGSYVGNMQKSTSCTCEPSNKDFNLYWYGNHSCL
eukprot:scaffold131170_cov21-Tisochrysis_lutea.AAC.2